MSEQTAWDLQPWRPPGAREFRVGDRVRIRLSGECQQPHIPGSYAAVHKLDSHPGITSGMTGVIVPHDYPDVIEGHPFIVRIDGGYVVNGAVWEDQDFAPSELELLTPAETAPTRTERPPETRFARESTSDTSDTVRAREAVDSAGEGG